MCLISIPIGISRRHSVSLRQALRIHLIAALLLASWLLTSVGGTSDVGASTLQSYPSTWPGAMTALYMETVDPATMNAWGCALPHSQAGWSGILLDFGQPWFENGGYGTNTFAPGAPFVTLDQIETAAENFIAGYHDCLTSGPTEFVIGTSNLAAQDGSGGYVDASHGTLWAQTVIRVNNWMTGAGYGTRYDAAGGSDMEVDYASSTATRSWAIGYSNVTNAYTYWDFGDCGGCPTPDITGCYYNVQTHPSCDIPNPTINNGWTVDDVYFVSWNSVKGMPLPEIYYNVNALQWDYIMLYGAARPATTNATGYWIVGPLTECVAENQQSAAHTFTPRQSWTTLFNLLNNDPTYSPYTQEGEVQWSADIAYQSNPNVSPPSLPIGTCYN